MSHPLIPAGFRAVNDFARHTSWLHAGMVAFAKYGVVVFAALLLLNWWFARSHGEAKVAAALWAPAGVLLSVGLNQPLGNAIGEPRPYAALPHVLLLVNRTSDFSFPSDHAVMSAAVAAGILVTDRRLGVLALGAALLMAFARVYVGAHYPVDVLAGLAFGAAVTVLAGLVARPLLRRVVRWLERTPLTGLVLSGRTAASS